MNLLGNMQPQQSYPQNQPFNQFNQPPPNQQSGNGDVLNILGNILQNNTNMDQKTNTNPYQNPYPSEDSDKKGWDNNPNSGWGSNNGWGPNNNGWGNNNGW